MSFLRISQCERYGELFTAISATIVTDALTAASGNMLIATAERADNVTVPLAALKIDAGRLRVGIKLEKIEGRNGRFARH